MSGLLLAMLDQTIVGTALPRIVEELDGSSLYLWVVTAYLVPATISLPVYARLSDRYGRRRLLLVGMGLFLAGSALGGAAPDMAWLVGARAVQGAGAGALEGLSFILIADLYGGRRNATLQAAMAGLMGFAFIAGPLIGGFLADHVGWRACFTVNLPIGLAGLTAIAVVLPASIGRSEDRRTPLDLAGIALLTVAVGLLLVGIDEKVHGGASGALPGWGELRTGGLVFAGLLVAALLLPVERRAPAPIIPVRLLADRRVGAICAAGTTATFALYAGVLLLPRYFQMVRHVSATHSGVLIYPLLLGLVVAVNLGAVVIVRRMEFRMPILAGLGLVALGAVGFGTFDASTPDVVSLVFMALLGLGIGPALSGLQIALQRSVAPGDMGAAMGTLMLLRQVGGAFALAAAETIYVAQVRGAPSPPTDAAATATGTAILVVALAGAALAAVALLSLPRGAARLPA
ncbi:MAG: major facilitator superfamily 1, partial [Conexibacter sp.]|nr:major facilitator superfamily 1 [Conexibacter sp.]